MRNDEEKLKCKDVNNFRLVDYLSSIGVSPKYVRGDYHWYLNPLTDEKKPSFRVNDNINRWKDWATGETGTLIDFAIKYHRCTVKEFLEIIGGNLSFQKPFVALPPLDPNSPEELKKRIIVTADKPLYHPALLTYLKERRIPIAIADRYCRQVHFRLYEKEMFAIGFKTDRGGWELRNRQFKGASSPKGITTIKVPGATTAAVIEGPFDFLSYQTLFAHEKQMEDIIILNSLSFFEETRPLLESYKETNLFLNNDPAGKKTTIYAISKNSCYKDRSSFLGNYEDINDMLCHYGHTDKPCKRISL